MLNQFPAVTIYIVHEYKHIVQYKLHRLLQHGKKTAINFKIIFYSKHMDHVIEI